MRPLRLTFSGFTCFKDEQNLDFSSLGLFAITGPTGAGKSSILDAMIFALYGRVPRIGKQGFSELISHGRTRAATTLDFEAGGRVFRVTRTAQRVGPSRAMLEEFRDGMAIPLADGIRGVDEQIVRLLGMPYEAFTQSVVLPQGEFAQFLGSAPAQRQEIIRDLLRLHVYLRMRQLATERSRDFGAKVAGLQQRLAEDFADATPELAEHLRQQIEAAGASAVAAEGQLMQARPHLEGVRGRYDKSLELEAARTELKRLGRKAPLVAELDRKLTVARRAAPILPLIEAMHEANNEAERKRQEHEATKKELRAAQVEHTRAKKASDASASAAKNIPKLSERIQHLAGLKGTLQARAKVQQRLQKAKKRLENGEAELQQAKVELQKAATQADSLAKEATVAENRLRDAKYDSDMHRLLEAVRERATELASARRQAAILAKDAQQLERDAARLLAEATSKERVVGQRRQRRERAMAKLESLRAQQEEAQRLHASAHLRSGLRRGQSCPVCGKPVAILPPRLTAPPLQELQAQIDMCRQQLETAQEHEQTSVSEFAHAKGEARRAEQQATRKREQGEEADGNVRALEEELHRKVSRPVKDFPGQNIEQRIAAAAKAITEAGRLHGKRLDELNLAKSRAEKAQGLADTARATVAERELQANHAANETQDASQELKELQAQIREVTTKPDPLAEKTELENRVKELGAVLESAQKQEQSASQALALAQQKERQAVRALTDAVKTAERAEAKAQAAAEQAGLPSVEDVAQAALAGDDEAQIRQQVDDFRGQHLAAAANAKRLEDALTGTTVSETDLKAATDAVRALEEQRDEAISLSASLREQLSQLQQRIQRGAELGEQLKELTQSHKIYRRLEEDLRADRFQSFVLEETLRDLIAGASDRLWRMTGRYTLQLAEDGEFLVVDHDNAMERRSADTLSGGETFMASLALALELSEQVQHTANAVPLGSLFIDEGFGTLDKQALDEVAATIEMLQAAGRLVGIITHIPELAAQMPAQLEVEKHIDGSRVRVLLGSSHGPA